MNFLPAIIVITIGTFIIYSVNKKKLIDKTTMQKAGKIGIYVLEMLLGLIVFTAIMMLVDLHKK